MPVRAKDIAQKLNISESTVSRALSDHPKISIKTKKKVNELVKKLNYRPNLIAKGLKVKKTKTIGLIIDDITNPFYPEIVKGCEEEANKKGLNLILCNSDYDDEKENEYINVLISKCVDGMIISPAGNKSKIVNLLKEVNIPLIFIDIKPSEKIKVSCVYADQEYGAYIATKYLISLGHRKIALVNGPIKFSSCQQLENGYKKALNDSSIPIIDDYIKTFNLKYSGTYEVIKSLLDIDTSILPTAALFISDISAVVAYDVIYEKGYKIPDYFSIIGNDNINTSKNFFPPLTTIEHPKYLMGKQAMEILINILNNEKEDFSKKVRYMPELIIRKSTAKPRRD